MRILQLRLKNLNSLVGEWHIDFTHPAFAADGIFAITGPTGAGKTTVLDAVCLALYGCTPRLGKVTRSGNEIMSRRTGECFAEVTFETQSGRFRCHWSQHRARRKASGELQPARQEIVDGQTGRVIETRLSGVADQIETVTGMDFDRFTRSMLLAQGGFANFLQAAADQRAPILEQITGTEIYSRISIHVHERRSAEQKKLDLISAELAAMQVLTADDEQQLHHTLEQHRLQETELSRQVLQLNQTLTWINGITHLEQQLAELQSRRRQWQLRQEQFAADRQRLQRAVRALELAGEHAALTGQRRQQDSEIRMHTECLANLPGREAAVQQAHSAWRSAYDNLEEKKEHQKAVLPVIRRVQALDFKLEEKKGLLQAAAESLAEQESALANWRARNAASSADLAGFRQALAEVNQQLSDSALDQGLVEHLAGIHLRCHALQEQSQRLRTKQAALAAAKGEFCTAEALISEKAAGRDGCRQQLGDVQNQLEQKQGALLDTLAGRDIGHWHSVMARLAEQQRILEKVADAVRRREQTTRALAELAGRRQALHGQKMQIEQRLPVLADRTAALEREIQLLETQLGLLGKIEDLAAERRELRDGEPCPLCGAKAHPYAAGNIPVPGQTAADLQRARTDLRQANRDVSALKVEQAEHAKDLEQVDVRREELTSSLAVAQTVIDSGLASLAPTISSEKLEELVPQRQTELREELQRLSQMIIAAETLSGQLDELRHSLEKVKESAALAERSFQDAEHARRSAGQSLERIESEAVALESERRLSEAQLLQSVAPFGIRQMPLEGVDDLLVQLDARRNLWLAHSDVKNRLEKDIAALAIETAHQMERIGQLAAEHEKQLQRHRIRRDELDGLSRERHELFGDKRCTEEEAALAEAVEAAAGELDLARRGREAADRELSALRSRLAELAKAIMERSAQLQSAQLAFALRLTALGFDDEADYLAACLSEAERTELSRQDRRLIDEHTELTAALREKEMLLQTERMKRLSDQSPESVMLALSEVATRHKELQQQIGGLQARLTENTRLKHLQQDKSQALEAQHSECRRWDLLHELIGSADGKKYRNFAQGLTFEIMIGHANRQLCRMSDRYLLVRDTQLPLELNVIDGYQAGETRSTKNLSGGESFIVSLALALGLSQMASRKVRVDSLFLDEGFGTLDEEALDTALETLAGLQRDGKLIGVISHLPALKERIPTQIQVVPLTGGRSIIAGPGCSRI